MKEFLEEINKLRQKINAFEQEVLDVVENEMVEAAKENTQKIADRIKSSGIVADGDREVRLTGYSLQGKKGKRWRDKRAKAGLQVGHKDLHFSGAMMGSMRVEKERSGGVINVFSGVNPSGSNRDGKSYSHIVTMLSQQEGMSGKNSVTDPTKSERDEFDKRVNDVMQRLVKELGL